jgi:hypothetical protein
MNDLKTSLQSALVQAVAEAMEVMAFEQVEPLSEHAAVCPPSFDAEALGTLLGVELDGIDPNAAAIPEVSQERPYWAKLDLIAPVQGEIIIETPAAYARNVTMALFDADGEVESDEAICDSLAEILNTIAGRVMAKVTPPLMEYQIGLPQTGIGHCPRDEAAIVQRFNAGGQELKLILDVRNLQELMLNGISREEVLT